MLVAKVGAVLAAPAIITPLEGMINITTFHRITDPADISDPLPTENSADMVVMVAVVATNGIPGTTKAILMRQSHSKYSLVYEVETQILQLPFLPVKIPRTMMTMVGPDSNPT